tara:strand:- start:284 stop:775 length:492 start_codon:yes stop_codon:yes gene_type:complete
MYPLLMQSIIDNMNLSNREELIAAMQQASQPNPQAQQMAMLAQQAQIELQQSQTAALQGQAAESQARAGKLAVESQIAPQELQIDLVNAVTKNLKEGDQEDKEFERRLKVADRLLKKREMEAKTQNANDANGTQQPVQPSQRRLQGAGPAPQGLESAIRPVGG